MRKEIGREERFTETQIIGFLREAEAGVPVKQLCRKHGFSEASDYLWRSKFGGMNVSDAKRLKELSTESEPGAARSDHRLGTSQCLRRHRRLEP